MRREDLDYGLRDRSARSHGHATGFTIGKIHKDVRPADGGSFAHKRNSRESAAIERRRLPGRRGFLERISAERWIIVYGLFELTAEEIVLLEGSIAGQR